MADYKVYGTSKKAPFSLTIHRGESMVLLAMDWKDARPPDDFVGFSIEFREPGKTRFSIVSNRIGFPFTKAKKQPSTKSPIQMFRWVYFPFNAEQDGKYRFRVTAKFMNAQNQLSDGGVQEAEIALGSETHRGKVNVSFTRGFISSQAFVDRYAVKGKVSGLLPGTASKGLSFKPTHTKAADAYAWMGFEARRCLLDLLKGAVDDPTAKVRMIAYDLNVPEIVSHLESLGDRLRIIIDDSADHGKAGSAENSAATRLGKTAGAANVRRQKLGGLQHNKFIVVDGKSRKKVLCGSTNFSWRGLFVQNNNVVVLTGKTPVEHFGKAFESYWTNKADAVGAFPGAGSGDWEPLGIAGIEGDVTFSPHNAKTAKPKELGDDIEAAKSSVLYSLAFLAQTGGAIRTAVKKVTKAPDIFVYGIADKEVGGLDLTEPSGNPRPVFPAALAEHVPEPFKSEPAGGGGIRMHHKFVVIDFDTEDARVYLGSYNFSPAADRDNGENLLVFRDHRIVTSYMVEALRIFDHYSYRVRRLEADATGGKIELRLPPRAPGETPWWTKYYDEPIRVRDRKMFAK